METEIDPAVSAWYLRYQDGLSCARVGSEFGVTAISVYHAFKRHGMQLRPRQVAIAKRRTGDDIVCAWCAGMFYRSPADRLGRGKNAYCSRQCMALAYEQRIGEKSLKWKGDETRPCDACGASITRRKWTWYERELTFCDTGCFGAWKAANWVGDRNPSWKGGHPPYYGPNWLRQRRAARRRDRYQCRLCGASEGSLPRALDVHHIRPFRLFGVEHYLEANRLANLVSLCASCHTHAERFSASGEITTWSELLARIGEEAAT